MDGSLTNWVFNSIGNRTSSTIVKAVPHMVQSGCDYPSVGYSWDSTVVCGQDKKVIKVQFMNLWPISSYYPMYVTHMADLSNTARINTTTIYSKWGSNYAKDETYGAFSTSFVTGNIYDIRWHQDFTHLAMIASGQQQQSASDLGILFRFNYTDNRELFEIGKMKGTTSPKSGQFFTPSTNILNMSTC
jgi:hypothetical protein